MTAYEVAAFLNISALEAQDLIERSDMFDRYMQSLYDLEAVERHQQGLDKLVESVDWGLTWSDQGIDD